MWAATIPSSQALLDMLEVAGSIQSTSRVCMVLVKTAAFSGIALDVYVNGDTAMCACRLACSVDIFSETGDEVESGERETTICTKTAAAIIGDNPPTAMAMYQTRHSSHVRFVSLPATDDVVINCVRVHSTAEARPRRVMRPMAFAFEVTVKTAGLLQAIDQICERVREERERAMYSFGEWTPHAEVALLKQGAAWFVRLRRPVGKEDHHKMVGYAFPALVVLTSGCVASEPSAVTHHDFTASANVLCRGSGSYSMNMLRKMVMFAGHDVQLCMSDDLPLVIRLAKKDVEAASIEFALAGT
jgi:hypothetical protein